MKTEEIIPSPLLKPIKLLLYGDTALVCDNLAAVTNTICQLLMWKMEGLKPKVKCEMPLPVYHGLWVHSRTRSKKLVTQLSDLGTCIPYPRVLPIEEELPKMVLQTSRSRQNCVALDIT